MNILRNFSKLNDVRVVVTNVGDHKVLRQFILSFLEDSDVLETIAKRSFRHPNGFVKIPILKDGNRNIRLHYYNTDDCHEEYHTHRWNFSSHIVFGELRHELGEITERNVAKENVVLGDDEFFEYKFQSKTDCTFSKTLLGTAKVSCARLETVPQNSTYDLSMNVPHRVLYSANVKTVTVVSYDVLEGSLSSEFYTKVIPEETNGSRDLFTVDQLKTVLIDILALIG